MGLKAMYIIEVKTRLIELGKEIDGLVKTAEQADAGSKPFLMSRLEDLQSRYQELEADHDFLRMFDEAEWGKFPAELDKSIHKLSHDVGVVRTEFEKGPVPA